MKHKGILLILFFFVLSCNADKSETTRIDPLSFRNVIADLAEKAIPVVVSIQSTKTIPGASFGNPFWDEFFYGPGRRGRRAPERKQQGLGSGVIVSKDGTILTNNHVVEGADELLVTLQDDRSFQAEIVGTDKETDIAVIRLKKKVDNLPVAELGNSDNLRVGDWVVAIGNPFGLDHTVTSGIVSAKGIHGRGITSYENFIQTDAAINPGNSGGALLDLDGKLVGINTAILSRTGGFQGIGFAIPIQLAKKVMNDLLHDGKVSRGWLGVSIQDLDPEIARGLGLENTDGVLVTDVLQDTPAEKGGIQIGDLILKLDGRKIGDVNELRHRIALIHPGSKAEIIVLRNGKQKKIQLVLASKDPEDETVAAEEKNSSHLGIKVSALNRESRHRLGIHERIQGVLISRVKAGSSAEKGGLRRGDIITQINRSLTKSPASFRKALNRALENNSSVVFLIYRDGGRRFIAIEKKD